MPRSRPPPDPASPRARIAAEAGRLLARDEAAGVESARRKAARRLGFDDPTQWPSEADVMQALRDYQRMFGVSAELPPLPRQLAAAEEALRHFAEFDAELCGGLAEQPPQPEPVVHLLLYSEDPDAPLLRLLDDGMAHRVRRGRLFADGLGRLQVDHLELTVDGIDFRLTPLPPRCRQLKLRTGAEGEPLRRRGASAAKTATDAAG